MDDGDKTIENDVRLQSFLGAHPEIDFIRFQWLDLSGIVRVRILPVSSAKRFSGSNKFYGVNASGMSMPACGEPLKPPPQQQQPLELRPDWDSLRPCGFAPRHAEVACNVALRNAERPFAQCPRHLLGTLLDDHVGLLTDVAVGFELEFSLLDAASNPLPDAGEIGNCWSTSGPIRGVALTILEEIVDALKVSGIAVFHFHTEDSPLLEVTLEALSPLQAVDAVIHAQETIRHVAAKHGLRGTLAPRPWDPRGPFITCHMHLSVPAAVKDPVTADHFLAGIMHRISSLCALGLPEIESMLSLREGIIGAAVGTWVSWGTQNRDGPIRRIEDGYWEIRIINSTANIYLVVAAILFSGVRGIKDKTDLELKDCTFNPNEASASQRQEMGIRTRMPVSLEESMAELRHDQDLLQLMGGEMVELYLRLKAKDNSVFKALEDEERRRRFVMLY